MKNPSISIIGLGFVGLSLAVINATKGFKTIGVDNNKEKINSLKKSKSDFVCLWCGNKTVSSKNKAKDKVRYSNKEHIFPEAIGGKEKLMKKMQDKITKSKKLKELFGKST